MVYHSKDQDFKEILSKNVTDEKAKSTFYRHSRPNFHRMLHSRLVRIGLKVEFGKEVVDYSEDDEGGRAGVVMKDGLKQDADLAVVADGVGGASWLLVAGQPIPASSSSDALYRVAFPVEHILSDPGVIQRFKFDSSGRSIIKLVFEEGWHAAFWRNEDEMSDGIQHKDHGTADEHWGHKINTEEILKFIATIPEWWSLLYRVIKATPKDAVVDYN